MAAAGIFIASFAAAGCAPQPPCPATAPTSRPAAIKPGAGLPGRAAAPWYTAPRRSWPLVTPGVESRYFSSFDRQGRNNDGFKGKYSSLYTLPSGEHVIFDALGPGILNTLWFTGPDEGGEGLDLGAVRFYFDDEPKPRISTDVKRLFGGKEPPFLAPLSCNNKVSTGGFVSWAPIPFGKRLIVTTARRAGFYIAQYDVTPVGTPLASWTPSHDAGALKAAFHASRAATPAGELKAVPLKYEHRGRGSLEVIRFEPAGPVGEIQLNQARIKITWDGAATPAVDVPLGMFFGSGLGEATIDSMAFFMRPGKYENRLPMPFWTGFNIEITGLAGKLKVKIGAARYSRLDAGYLNARYREEFPTKDGEDFQWLDIQGAGKLVGTVLTIWPHTPHTKRWWEGDLRSYADGRRTPGLHGTGHEDDHLGGWSNTFFGGPFTLPMHGEPRVNMIERKGVQHNAQITLYRLWPGINFTGGLRHSVEHGSTNKVVANYAGVAFYYALGGPGRLTPTDRLDLGDAASRREHDFSVKGDCATEKLDSAFEGRAFEQRVADVALSHAGVARFDMTIKPKNRGCYLRRVFDQRQARQRASVLVDSARFADWYTAEGNASLRWAERDIFLPPHLTRGKRSIQITVRPAAGAPPWSAAEYRALCVEEPGT